MKSFKKQYFEFIWKNRVNKKMYMDKICLERHHVVPKSIGGSPDEKNCVYLTSENHKIAHFLLNMWLLQSGEKEKIKKLDYYVSSTLFDILNSKMMLSNILCKTKGSLKCCNKEMEISSIGKIIKESIKFLRNDKNVSESHIAAKIMNSMLFLNGKSYGFQTKILFRKITLDRI